MEKENLLEIGEIYRHFKGDKYKIVMLPIDGNYNDDRISVVYANLSEKKTLSGKGKYSKGTYFSSSLERFCGEKVFEKDCEINNTKYKKGDKVKRFTKI